MKSIKLCSVWICILLLTVAMPACFGASYTTQAERITSSVDWDKVSPYSLAVSADAVDDPDAVGGRALQVVDTGTTVNDWLAYRSGSAGPLGASATAVIRIKTGDPSSFSGDLWTRNIVLSFASGGSAKRSVGLAIKPNGAIVCNTVSTQFYPNATPIEGDNTGYVTWAIVARNYGYKFDIYRNGVKVISDADNASGGEGSINPAPGYYSLAIGAATNAPGTVTGSTGSWFIDYAGYKSGEDPTWDPFNLTPKIVGKVTDVGTGQPAEGVLLRLNTGVMAVTDANGDYVMNDVDPGSYTITANGSNHYALTVPVPVEVPESEAGVCNFQMVRIPDPVEIITDDFNRPDGPDLGMAATTVDPPGHYAWTGDTAEAVPPSISNGRLSLGVNSGSYASVVMDSPSTAGFDLTMDV